MRLMVPEYIKEMYLMLTEFCPLRCDYCYIKDRTNTTQMSLDTVDKAIRMFNNKKIKIIFFGGEPLAAFDLLETIFKKYKDKMQFQIITSGIVNFEKLFKFYKKYHSLIDLQLSWDGNITGRFMLTGDNKQNQAYENILQIGKAGYGVQVRCVINDININNFFNTYMNFRALKQEYRIIGDFTISHQNGFKQNFQKNLKTQIELILNQISQDLRSKDNIYIPQYFIKTIINIFTKTSGSSCDIGNYIIIRPNGDIYPCTILSQNNAANALMGNVNSPNKINFELINKFRTIPNTCLNCDNSTICDGGCRYERYVNFENWEDNICSFTCEHMNILNSSINLWYNSLSLKQKDKLFKICIDYNTWLAVDYTVSDLKNKYKEIFISSQ